MSDLASLSALFAALPGQPTIATLVAGERRRLKITRLAVTVAALLTPSAPQEEYAL